MVSFLQQNGLAAPILQDKSFGQGAVKSWCEGTGSERFGAVKKVC